MKPTQRIVLGDPAAEIRATEILAIALNKGAESASRYVHEQPRAIPIPPLLVAAANFVTLATLNAPNPPLAILALAARNTFELYIRLKHIVKSDANSLASDAGGLDSNYGRRAVTGSGHLAQRQVGPNALGHATEPSRARQIWD